MRIILPAMLAMGGCASDRVQPPMPDIAIELKKPMQFQRMNQALSDCGPVQEFNCLRYLGYDIPLSTIKTDMRWNADYPNLTDTLINHTRFLNKHDIIYKDTIKLTEREIIDQLFADFPTIVLLKTGKLQYHWITILGFSPGKGWLIAWGDGRDPLIINESGFKEKFKHVGIIFKSRK